MVQTGVVVEEYGEPKYGALAWAGIGISFRAQPCSQGSLLPVYQGKEPWNEVVWG